MDELGLEFFSKEKQKEIINKMSLSERAQIKCWPEYLSTQGINRFSEYLSIKEICDLLFPVPGYRSKPADRSLYSKWQAKQRFQADKNKGFKEFLINACANNGLLYEGDIKGWHYYGDKNKYPLAKQGNRPFCIPGDDSAHYYEEKHTCGPECCTIHKSEFKHHMQSSGKWVAVNQGSLAKWWSDDTKEITPNQIENQATLQEPVNQAATKKALGKRNKLRIESLKVFIRELQATAIRKDLDFDPEHMGCSKKVLLKAINQWAKKRKDNTVIRLWRIDKFDNNLWLSDERKSICDIETSPNKQFADFFEKFHV